jgi:hypothetical protein
MISQLANDSKAPAIRRSVEQRLTVPEERIVIKDLPTRGDSGLNATASTLNSRDPTLG